MLGTLGFCTRRFLGSSAPRLFIYYYYKYVSCDFDDLIG